jgi:hypothetical protein
MLINQILIFMKIILVMKNIKLWEEDKEEKKKKKKKKIIKNKKES